MADRETRGLWGWLLSRWRALSAPGLFIVSFAILVAVGTLGLWLLPGFQVGPRLGFVDALFTITSAVCVTGLVVVDTATHFTTAGQLWLLVSIQLGGIGMVTLTSLVIGTLGRRLVLRTELVAVPALRVPHGRELVALARAATAFVLLFEAAGALLLWLLWIPRFGAADAAWHALFHAVGAFCNAGFSTFSDSLVGQAQAPGVLLTISALVIVGGFGYIGGAELVRWARSGGLRGPTRLSTHTFAAVTVTALLLVVGAMLYGLFEWRGALAELSVGDRLVNAWFMSVTTRTAGFNTVAYDQVGNASGFLTILLMIIGGSPGSMAGGIKVTAFAVLGALALSRMRGRRFVELHGRAIPDGTVQRTVSVTLLAFTLVTAAVFVLSFTETRGLDVGAARPTFLPLMFEAVSAFATVGLSMDVTPGLTTAGKLIVTALMFLGRVGPLAFFAAISLRASRYPADLRPAREDLIVG